MHENEFLRMKELIKDLKKLSIKNMRELSGLIRNYIIEVVSENGGHLASSLGTVELAICLHNLFNSPEDKIIWDVGHQAYAHKILTGRIDSFKTLRQYKGVSGFPRMCENEHDAFGVGHSSTSISAAVGYAIANRQNMGNKKVVAIIGDGSISSGMPFEAMNQASQIKDLDIIVILNDNEMSISPNVGALSRYFNKLRTDPIYNRLRDDVEILVSKIPAIGRNMVSVMDRVSTGVKTVIDPGAFFLHLGWNYFGPIDGHDLTELMDTLRRLRKIKGLKILHVTTVKGRGYKPAEMNPSSFHGVGPFDIETGEKKKSSDTSFTSVAGDYMVELGKENTDINVITAAMPDGTGASAFSADFPSRFFDVGISEEHAPTFAAALAAAGKIPLVCIYSTFMQRAYDQVMHDVALQGLPVIFLMDRAGVVGEDGATHHGTFDLSYMRTVPGMIISAPRDAHQLKRLMKTAVFYRKGPFAIRYPRGAANTDNINEDVKLLEIGKSECLKKGEKVAIISCGYISINALKACEVNTFSVYDFKFIKPLDTVALDQIAEEHHTIIVYEDNTRVGGLGSAVLEYLADSKDRPKIILKGIEDKFVEHGKQSILRENLGFTTEEIKGFISQYEKKT